MMEAWLEYLVSQRGWWLRQCAAEAKSALPKGDDEGSTPSECPESRAKTMGDEGTGPDDSANKGRGGR